MSNTVAHGRKKPRSRPSPSSGRARVNGQAPISTVVKGVNIVSRNRRKSQVDLEDANAPLQTFKSSTGSIETLRNALNSGEYVSMTELFPNGVDRQSREIPYHLGGDSKLNLRSVERELASIKAEQAKETPQTGDYFLTHPEEILAEQEQRKTSLVYYGKIIREALDSWKEYDTARRSFMLSRDHRKGKDPLEEKRFDDEYRRFKARQDSKQFSPLALKRIVEVNAVMSASKLVANMENQNGVKGKKFDSALERTKLSAEIRQWQTRSIMGSVSTMNGITRSMDVEQLLAREWNRLKLDDLAKEQEGASDVEEVIIIDDITNMHASTSGFFVTSSVDTEEESNGEEVQDGVASPMTPSNSPLIRLNVGNQSPTEKESPRNKKQGSISDMINIFDTVSRKSTRYSSIDESSNIVDTSRDAPNRCKRYGEKQDGSNDTTSSMNQREISSRDQPLAFSVSTKQIKATNVLVNDMQRISPYSDKSDDGMVSIEPLKWGDNNEEGEEDSVIIDDPENRNNEFHRAQHVNKLMEDLKEQVEYNRHHKDSGSIQPDTAERVFSKLFKTGLSSPSSRIKIRSPEPPDSMELSPLRGITAALEKEAKQLVVELNEQLGFGGYSKVYRGVIVDTGEYVAVKKITLNNGKMSKKVVKLEIDILRQLRHPNLVMYRGCKVNKRECNIVLEYVPGGSLDHHLSKTRSLDERYAASILLQVLCGLEYLHKKKILHRDIKPGNILISEDGQTAKLADFGVSAQLMSLEGTRTSCTGTPWFVAPEVIQVQPYSYQADIWSVGSTCYEMVTGQRPWGQLNQVAAMYKIVTEGHPPLENLDISRECKEFMETCWVRDWKNRPDATTLKQHPWLQRRNETTG